MVVIGRQKLLTLSSYYIRLIQAFATSAEKQTACRIAETPK